ncbi:MAG TPA: hypothetical protein PLP61_13725 [Nocardioides sp.]|uniref:hypothetical protein n=1 Tax=Nocardioides sp. TaxID=35761 RepID=UPI002CA5D808|nr:hypothetical protein [Nocardioides sp.]HQR28093.1 hypothetical protein [Nocardioides sp.]
MNLSRRGRALMVLALLTLIINLPLVTSLATERQVRRNGVDVSAQVVRTWTVDSGADRTFWVSFTLPERLDPGQTEYAAQVVPDVYAGARDGALAVRVLPDRPSAHLVDGRVAHRTGLWLTLAADALLALGALLLWRSGRYSTRPEDVRLEAVGDVEADPGDGASPRTDEGLTELADGTWRARGTVVRASADEVVLDLVDREAIVILDGHQNPVGPGEVAVARGRLLDR